MNILLTPHDSVTILTTEGIDFSLQVSFLVSISHYIQWGNERQRSEDRNFRPSAQLLTAVYIAFISLC